jgi:hypothetical protein
MIREMTMPEVLLCGIGLLLCLASWRWMYQPSLLDQARDKIFDLRQDVRSHFIEKGYGLDHPIYKALRDLINGHLRYTRDASLIRFLYMVFFMQRNPVFARQYKTKMDKQFASKDKDLELFANNVRMMVFAFMLEYLVKKSLVLLVMLRLAIAFAWLKRVATAAKRAMVGEFTAGAFARAAALSGALLTLGSLFGVGSRTVAQEAMESCALRAL